MSECNIYGKPYTNQDVFFPSDVKKITEKEITEKNVCISCLSEIYDKEPMTIDDILTPKL
jgi:hypothetical protein